MTQLDAQTDEAGVESVTLVLEGSRVVSATGPTRDLLGLDETDVVGMELFQFVHPDDLRPMLAFLALRGAGGLVTHTSARVRHSGGSWTPVSVSHAVHHDDESGSTDLVRMTRAANAESAVTIAELFRGSPPIFMVCDEHTILAATPSTVDVLGCAPEALISGYPGMLHPDDLATTLEMNSMVNDSPGTVVTQVGRMLHSDGTFRIVETSAVNLLADPACHATYVATREVPQPTSVARSTESVNRFQAMINQAADPVLMINTDGVITFASPSFEELLKRPGNEVIGRFARELVHPEDIDRLGEWYQKLLTSPGESATQRLRLFGADGLVWVEAHLTNFIEDQTLKGMLASVRDISAQVEMENELRASEARFREQEAWYRALVSHSFEITAVVDADLVMRWLSPSAEELLGWKPEDVVGQQALDYVHPDDHEVVAEHLAIVLSGTAPRPNTTLRVRLNDGTYTWFDTSASDRLADPAVAGLIINLRDASARMEAEQALHRSEARYRQLVQNSTDVVQIMSASGEVLWISPAIETVLGWRPDEVLAHPTGGMAGFQGRDQALAAFLEVLDHPGRTVRTVSHVEHANGSLRWIDIVLVNRLDDPDIAGIVATYRDVTDQVAVDQALRESEQRFRSLSDSSPLGIFQFDLETNCTYVNDRWCEIVGHPAEEALGQGWRSIMLPEHASMLEDPGLVDQAATNTLAFRGRFMRGDGTIRWADIRTAPLNDSTGNRVGTVGTIDDVTDRVEAQHETEMLTTILEATPDLVGIAGRDGRVLYLNGASRDFFGISQDVSLNGTNLLPFIPLDSAERWQAEIQPSLRARDTWQGEVMLSDPEGRAVPFSAVFVAHRGPDHHIEQISVSARDISDRKALEARLEHEATHDPLTGLPNRTLLLDRLEMAIGRARRQRRRLAVLFLDLDHFKVVNDSLGHSTGDQLLAAVAARLTDHMRPGDTVARFGGDEFVVVCEEIESIYEVQEIAQRIALAVSEPLWIAESEVFVTASIGIALASDLHQTPEQLLRDADAAMYQAKAKGRSRHEVFDSRLRTRALDRLEVESALRRALVRHELRVHYQPCFALDTGKVTGVEALLRWDHPQRGLLLPAEFLGVAEETGLIVAIGTWVAHQACRQMERLRHELPAYEGLQVAVNLSARQIGHPNLVDEIAKVLTETGARPDTLVLEITESVLMDDVPTNATTLRKLKALGVSIAIDDFGTGYSSLAYLRRFPIDILKVDRSFVNGLGADPEDAAIANAVITLAHTLGMEALAEGVENEVQRSELIRLGCDQAQGFLLGRPMSAADLTDFLVNRQPAAS